MASYDAHRMAGTDTCHFFTNHDTCNFGKSSWFGHVVPFGGTGTAKGKPSTRVKDDKYPANGNGQSKAALGNGGGAVAGGLAVRPAERVYREMHESQYGCAGVFAAHRAMADHSPDRCRGGTIAYRTTQTPAFENVFLVHGSLISRVGNSFSAPLGSTASAKTSTIRRTGTAGRWRTPASREPQTVPRAVRSGNPKRSIA